MDLDKGLVGWDDENDLTNPLNWSWGRRWRLMGLVAVMSTLSPMSSSICAPGTSLTLKEFNVTSNTIGSLMISIFVLGYAIGPLFLAPLSEMYGRVIVVNISSTFFTAFMLGCSFAPNMPSLIIMRLLAGIGGSAVMTIVPAVVGDCFPYHKRAMASAIVIGTPTLAPIVGPIAGGFISEQLGWRWAYWILVMASGPFNLLMVFFMDESNHATILQRKTDRLRKELGRDDLHSQLEIRMTSRELLAKSIVRPMKFLTRSPIVFLISFYVAVCYGTLYLLFTTIPIVFEEKYGWSIQMTGLAYLGLGVGMFINIATIMRTNDRTVLRLRAANNGIFEPEMRLSSVTYYAIFMPIGLFIYGWCAEYRTHWILPCLAFIPFGFGLLGIFLPCQTYMVDAFLTTSASAVAALVCFRSAFGAFLPLAGPPLYDKLGLGWGNSVLGFLTLVMTPIPWVFFRYGGRVRRRWPVEL
ncbi:MFS general substrate transporter [Mytilinidion resinicola]|uniref:MFS general substrate transporter n=1 Tax=Mytilinidion resinicola TaxID=574789 RepID=A0A6A6YL27_9PEZI|nr:MFS general substrate transporter [Mytilinidion resinicola]KAF2808674.1 MFS general substrate transporter [Mytilinidion resinicola]